MLIALKFCLVMFTLATLVAFARDRRNWRAPRQLEPKRAESWFFVHH